MPRKPVSDAYVLGVSNESPSDTPTITNSFQVGLTQFIKPRKTRDYVELGYEAGVKAMLDAGITYDDVEHGVACYCYGDTCSGQRIFYQFGMNSIPIYNTSNACATGSTGLHMARTLVRTGAADCVLVVGFEQMAPGSISSPFTDRPSPMQLGVKVMEETYGKHDSPRNAQYFANAGKEYMEKCVQLPKNMECEYSQFSQGTVPKQKTSQRSRG